jgi:DNA-binding response OmpR family regulator
MRRDTAVILYAEDNLMLGHAVRDALELAGWKVYHFTESSGARMAVASLTHFDLMLLDQEMPHLSGVELTRHARRLPHRRETPIILCSIEDCDKEAREAGADVFLRKPANIIQIVDVIRHLLKAGNSESR